MQPTIPLRVSVTWRTRSGERQSSVHYFELGSGSCSATPDEVSCLFHVAELDAAEVPRGLRDRDVARSERQRLIRYMERADRRVESFQSGGAPTAMERARARFAALKRRLGSGDARGTAAGEDDYRDAA